MKKIYIQPQLTVTNIQPTSSLMIVSTFDVIDPASKTISKSNDILVKKNYTDYNVWDDDWSN